VYSRSCVPAFLVKSLKRSCRGHKRMRCLTSFLCARKVVLMTPDVLDGTQARAFISQGLSWAAVNRRLILTHASVRSHIGARPPHQYNLLREYAFTGLTGKILYWPVHSELIHRREPPWPACSVRALCCRQRARSAPDVAFPSTGRSAASAHHVHGRISGFGTGEVKARTNAR
jgi:hypothetical protein